MEAKKGLEKAVEADSKGKIKPREDMAYQGVWSRVKYELKDFFKSIYNIYSGKEI